MTAAERLLLLLVADALLAQNWRLGEDTRKQLHAARDALDAEAFAGLQGGVQGVQPVAWVCDGLEASDAASDAPRPGTEPPDAA